MSSSRANPYVGPRAFRTGEELYGRDRELRDVLDLLISERLLLLHSPSGAGKTSLIRAGLIPRLQIERFEVLPVIRLNTFPPVEISKDAEVNRYVFSALLSLEEALVPERQSSPEELARLTLSEYWEKRLPPDGDYDGRVFIFDQFEEAFTLDPTDLQAKTELFSQLGEFLRERNRWALFAIREDYLAALEPFLRFVPTRLRNTFRLRLLEPYAARQAIQRPAASAGVEFEEEAAQMIVDDLRQMRVQRPDGSVQVRPGPSVEPVQLQVVCLRLWGQISEENDRIGPNDIRNLGNVDTAIAEYYEEQVGETSRKTGVKERAIREWFESQLINVQGIRDQVLMGSGKSGGLENPAIRLLENAHLVRAEKRGGVTRFELTHDRLIDPVRRSNAAWFRENLNLLQRQAGVWAERGRAPGLLLRANDLAEAEKWATENQDGLLKIEVEFLEACKQLRAREQAEAERRRRLWIGAISAMLLLILLSVWAVSRSIAATRSENRAINARATAELAEAIAEAEAQVRGTQQAIAEAASTEALEQRATAEQEAQVRGTQQAIAEAASTEALEQRATAEQEAQLSLSRELAAQSERALTSDPELGLLLAVWSVRVNRDAGEEITTESERALLQALQFPFRSTLRGHSDPITAADFSPDGDAIATASEDGTIRLWGDSGDPILDTAGNPLILEGHEGPVTGVKFVPGKSWIVSVGADGTARLWDRSGTPVLNGAGEPVVFADHSGEILHLDINPDGTQLVTGGEDSTARLWNLSDRDPGFAHIFRGHRDQVTAVAFSPDGSRVLTGSRDWTARLWDTESGAWIAEFVGHDEAILSVGFSPDGTQIITSSHDNSARIWRVEDFQLNEGFEPLILEGHGGSVKTARFNPDGSRIVTAGFDGTARVWDAESGELKGVLGGHTDRVNVAGFSPDGEYIVTTSVDATARLWNAANFLPNAANFRILSILPGHTDQLRALAFSADGSRLITTSDDGTARLWDLENPQILRGHTQGVLTASYRPDGRQILTGGFDQTARLWDAHSGETLRVFRDHIGWVWSGQFSPDGSQVVTGSQDGTARVWDASSGELIAELRGHSAPILSVDFSPDGSKIITAGEDGTARFWQVDGGPVVDPAGNPILLEGHSGDIWAARYSPDGSTIVTAGRDQTARLWDAESGQERVQLLGHENWILFAEFSQDGSRVITASDDGTARVWDAQTGMQLILLFGHNDSVRSATFGPDDQHILTASDDGTARIWDAASGQELLVLKGHAEAVRSADFSPDGTLIVTVSNDLSVRIWEIWRDIDAMVAESLLRAGRDLTDAECQRFLHVDQCPPGDR